MPNGPLCQSGGIEERSTSGRCEAADFDVLITVGQNIPDQQNLAGRIISLVILCGPTNRLRDLEPLVPAAIAALRSIGRGDVVRISQMQAFLSYSYRNAISGSTRDARRAGR